MRGYFLAQRIVLKREKLRTDVQFETVFQISNHVAFISFQTSTKCIILRTFHHGRLTVKNMPGKVILKHDELSMLHKYIGNSSRLQTWGLCTYVEYIHHQGSVYTNMESFKGQNVEQKLVNKSIGLF